MIDGILNLWMTEYGQFEIPDDIYRKTPWKTNKQDMVVDVLPGPASRHFWNWLHDEEVKAGKTVDRFK